jgi:inner membrane protein
MFETEPEPEKRRWRDSIGAKMGALGGLVILLLIPLGMVGSLVGERQQRQSEAAAEVANLWGRPQVLGGPVLTIPLKTGGYYLRVLPETLRIEGSIHPERRSRGIYEAAVYRTELQGSGTIRLPDLAGIGADEADIRWDEAYLTLGVPDLRGIQSGLGIRWGDRELQLEPDGPEDELWDSGLRVKVPGLARERAGQAYTFAFNLGLSGSQRLQFIPMGKQTTVVLHSRWPSPSFSGAFLPQVRRVDKDGFQAQWQVSWFGRGYPQQWTTLPEAEKRREMKAALASSAFGVDLFLPVDAYQKTERSTKYGVLFLLLTFLTFFLYEVFSGLSLHPMQYLLVGAALCLFYLLLLSISEHAPFGISYLAAAAATVLLIGGYSAAVLRGRLRALLMTLVLGVLYGYLYVLLQLEDYALLLGAAGLFAILALVMYLTRRIDWGGPRRGKSVSLTEVVTPR